MFRNVLVTILVLGTTAATAAAQGGMTQPKQGQGGSAVQGAAGTGGSTGDKGLEHCDRPMGAVAVVEPQSEIITSLSRYGLQSPVGLIRLMIQQSNCFIVVERGAGMRNLMQERDLAASGGDVFVTGYARASALETGGGVSLRTAVTKSCISYK